MRSVLQPDSFDAWRHIARELLQDAVSPEQVIWTDTTEPGLDLFNDNPQRPAPSVKDSEQHRVSKRFVELAQTVACHRDPNKWAILYRILWKLTHSQARLLDIGLDEDVTRCNRMVSAIRRDCHKMKAFVRFREMECDATDTSSPSRFVSWFEPEHLIVKRMASFFKKRFANMHWSILTPDTCVHWDQKNLLFTEGVEKTMAPDSDDFENLWLTYYKNIFNPARLKEKAMCSEMPKKYWKNLPESVLIPELTEKGKRSDVSREWDSLNRSKK